MTLKRYITICAVAFVISEALAVAVHGFLLAADYAPFYGTLLRSTAAPPWQAAFLPVAHLCFICALVWVYGRIVEPGRWVAQGLRLGALGWLLGQAPLWLVWYAEQPWPGALVLKQLALEFLSSLLIGLAVAAMVRGTAAQRK